MRVILYARVSTKEQSEGWSLPTQLEALRRFAEAKEFTVVAEFEDTESGATLQRSGLERARALLRAGKAAGIVIYSLDLLARDFGQSWLLRDDLLRGGVSLWYAQSGRQASLDGEDTLPDDLLALFAHREHKAIRERTMRGKRGKALEGRYIGNGTAPFGYNFVGRSRELQLEVNEDQARIVRRIFHEYAVQQRSVREIADDLTTEALPTPGDLKAYTNKKRRVSQWAHTNVYDILKRTVYGGQAEFFRRKTRRDANGVEHRSIASKEDRLYVTVQPLIDKTTWEAAQKRLAIGRERSERRRHREYLLSGGRMLCECGYVMRGGAAVPKDGPERLYYRCGGRYNNAISCTMPTVSATRVDALFWNWLKESLLDPVNLRKELERQMADQDSRATGLKEQLAAEQGRLDQLAGQIERLLELYADDRIPRGALDAQIGTKSAAQEAVKQRISELEEQLRLPLTPEIIAGLVLFSEHVSNGLEAMERDFPRRQKLIEVLDGRAIARREEDGRIKLRFRSVLRESVLEYDNSATNSQCSESDRP